MKASACIALLGGVVIAVSSLWWGHGLATGGSYALVLSGVMAFVGATISASMAVLRVQERAKVFVVVVAIQSLGGQLLGLTAVTVFRATAVTYLAGYVAGGAIAAFAATSAVGAVRARRADASGLTAALRIGLPMLPAGLSVIALGVADRILLQLLAGPKAVGEYTVAYLVGSIPMVLVMAVQNAWAPLTYSASTHSRWKQLSYTTTYVLGLSAVVAGAIALVAPMVMMLVLPGHYQPSALAPVVALVAFAVIPDTIYVAASQVLLWEKATLAIGWIVPAAAGCNIVAVYALYHPLGFPGVAAATPLALAVGPY